MTTGVLEDAGDFLVIRPVDNHGGHGTATHVNHHRVLAGPRQHGLLRFVSFTHRVSVPNRLNLSPALKKAATAQAQLRLLGLLEKRIGKRGDHQKNLQDIAQVL